MISICTVDTRIGSPHLKIPRLWISFIGGRIYAIYKMARRLGLEWRKALHESKICVMAYCSHYIVKTYLTKILLSWTKEKAVPSSSKK